VIDVNLSNYFKKHWGGGGGIVGSAENMKNFMFAAARIILSASLDRQRPNEEKL
jgi:hypothetical protein